MGQNERFFRYFQLEAIGPLKNSLLDFGAAS